MQRDDIYLKDVDDTPDIKACLIHSDVRCIKTYEAETTFPNFAGVTYGLCQTCIDSVEVDATYVGIIEAEIVNRLKNLRQH